MSEPQGPRQESGDRVETPGRPTIGERPPAKSPEDAQQTARRAMWLGLGALLLMFTPIFPLALVLAVAALVVGVKARKAARAAHRLVPGSATAGIVLGVVALTLGAFLVVVSALTWSENADYQKCLGAANTNTDKQECVDRYKSDLERKFNLPKGSVDNWGLNP